MPSNKADWVDDLVETRRRAWALLGRGAADRRAAFHTPTVATIGLDGRPRLRTVVLRHVDQTLLTLRFHTDRRSEKITELQRDPRLGLHFYDPEAKIQVRLDATATINSDDPVADAAWAASQRMSRVCYGTLPAPGMPIEASDAFALPADDGQIAAGRSNFAAVVARVHKLEWLYLAHDGHRRAIFDEATAAGSWLAP